LGEEGGEVAPTTTTRAVSSSKPSGSSTTKPQGQKPYENRGQGRQGSNTRTPREKGTDPVDSQKKTRPPRRDNEKKPPKTEERLDRHSGTGRSFENKKSGHGKANWGQAEREDEEKVVVPVVEPEPVIEESEEDKKKREEEEKKKEEERIKEEKQITLEDYLKQKKSVNLSLPPPRSANEGMTEQEKKKWAALPVETVVSTPKTGVTATTPVSKEEKVVSGNEHLNVLGEFFTVRIKDDAHSRRRQQRFDAEKRDKEKDVVKPVVAQTGASLLAEDPRVKNTQQKKKRSGKVPTKEDFPTLKA